MLFFVMNISEVSLKIGGDGETSRAQMAGVGLFTCVSPKEDGRVRAVHLCES